MTIIVKKVNLVHPFYSLNIRRLCLAHLLQYNKKEDEMTVLTQIEILEELEKFGVTTPTEVSTYMTEYNKYIDLVNSQLDSQG